MSSDEEDYGSDLDDSLLLAASNQLERQTELPTANRAINLSPANGANAEEDYFEGLFTSDLVDNEEEIGPPDGDALVVLRQRNLFGQVITGEPVTVTTARSHRLTTHQEPPTHHKIDREAAKTWIYPTNVGHRDYQFNIVKRALFDNVLVALPTGLGKTFIAATVMLNWYRWAPESQIIFMAPTKPLVTQQVDACFKIAGIPRSATCLLTGNVSPGHRAEFWQEKRVFFMTPQTLETDLSTGRCDPKRISLIVIDEAHRATGAYAYTKVISFLRRFNNSFRVMALTATPGSKIETVQEVISSLGIARTEIRTEESLDIREYINKRNIDVETFPLSDEIVMLKDLFSEILSPPLKKLNEVRAYHVTDPTMLTTFGCHDARNKWQNSPAGRTANQGLKMMVMNHFTLLATLAYAFELLLYHGIRPFYEYINEFYNTNSQKPKGGGKLMTSIIGDRNFLTILGRCRNFFDDKDSIGHPKLDFLCSTILRHFADAAESGEDDTRVMVFSNYRKSGEEILRVLKMHQPIIKPQIFVGQSAGKTGEGGMTQKEQQAVVEKFKAGDFNVLIATSIGEEGLDIGEVDFIVCYDASASPIRMLQRMGRTGRKRTGGVLVLVTEGKEFKKWEKANDNYRWIQNKIALGKDFQYTETLSPRIIPADIQPQCDKQFIEPPEENSQSEPARKNTRVRKKAPPRRFNMPDNVETGFTTAAKLGDFARASSGPGTSSKAIVMGISDLDEELVESLDEPVSTGLRNPEAGFLTLEEEDLLQRRYMYTLEEDCVITYPNLSAHHEHQRKLTPTQLMSHSRRTMSVVSMLGKMPLIDEIQIGRYKANLVHTDTLFKKPTPVKTFHSVPLRPLQRNSSGVGPAASTISKLAAFKAPSRTGAKGQPVLSERSKKNVCNKENIKSVSVPVREVRVEKPSAKMRKIKLPSSSQIEREIAQSLSLDTSPGPSQTLVLSQKRTSKSRSKENTPISPIGAEVEKGFMNTPPENSQDDWSSPPAIAQKKAKKESRVRGLSESSDDLPSAAQLTQSPWLPTQKKRASNGSSNLAKKKQKVVSLTDTEAED